MRSSKHPSGGWCQVFLMMIIFELMIVGRPAPLYLCSPSAAFVTGANLVVAGGETLY